MADACTHPTGRSTSPRGDRWGERLAALLSLPGRSRPRSRARLDSRELSDHLMRDMGFLDGNDPAGRRR